VPEDDNSRYRAPALDKGLDILEFLAATEASRSQAEIAKALDRSPSEIYRMLDRLVRRNYVRRTEQDRYELTLKLFEVAHQTPPLRRLIAHATPVLSTFAAAAVQAAHMVVFDHGSLVVVAQVEAPGYWSLAIRVGSRVSFADTGSGHVMLAFATEDQRDTMHRESAVISERLALVRERGYEMMPSQQIEGVTNLAVPVFGPQKSIVAVLSCPFVRRVNQPDAASADRALKLLLAAAAELSGTTP